QTGTGQAGCENLTGSQDGMINIGSQCSFGSLAELQKLMSDSGGGINLGSSQDDQGSGAGIGLGSKAVLGSMLVPFSSAALPILGSYALSSGEAGSNGELGSASDSLGGIQQQISDSLENLDLGSSDSGSQSGNSSAGLEEIIGILSQ